MGLHVTDIKYILFTQITPQVDSMKIILKVLGTYICILLHIYLTEHIELPTIKFWITNNDIPSEHYSKKTQNDHI